MSDVGGKMGERAGAAVGTRTNGNGALRNGALARETPVVSRLSKLTEVVPPPEICELWVFPPLRDLDDSEEFFLFTRFFEGETRRIYSARMLPANGRPAKQVVVEHGTVPADRVPGLVGRLQRRTGQEAEARHVLIDGRVQRWEQLLAELRDEATRD